VCLTVEGRRSTPMVVARYILLSGVEARIAENAVVNPAKLCLKKRIQPKFRLFFGRVNPFCWKDETIGKL